MPTLAVVLDLLRERGTASRVELAEASGLTQATMTHAVRKLIALGFVQEVGTARASRGTPRRLLALQPGACYTVGVQFDRFAAFGVVVDLAGDIVARRRLPAPGSREPGTVVAEFGEHIASMLVDADVDRAAVLGIGLSTHGPQDREAGVLLTPSPTPAWRGYPLAAALEEVTGLPVAIENDATAAGLGVQAAASSPSSFAVVFMAGGIGSGVILEGYPYRGVTSNGLELGHISVDAHGAACDCGNRGCVDGIAGTVAVTTRARRDPALAARLGLTQDLLADFAAIGRAALNGDAAAKELITTSARMLSVATVTLVNLFDLGRVVLAGNAFTDLGEVYRAELQKALDESVFMRHVHPVRAELADDVAYVSAVGGAVVVLRNLLESTAIGARTELAR
jgi:predicted NBD/HSP70 family sugar kinase